MGNPDYTIDSNLTANKGRDFLDALTGFQAGLVTSLVDLQREDLNDIVSARRDISTELRRLMTEGSVDRDAVLELAERYGELDGEIVYYYATHFAEVAGTLSDAQRAVLTAVRDLDDLPCSGAFLYSESTEMPEIRDTDFLFGAGE